MLIINDCSEGIMEVYFDNNATTRTDDDVVEAMRSFWGESYANPSSIHMFGGKVQKHIEKARENVASLINADPSEVFFTSGGTESDNLAIQGVARSSIYKDRSKKYRIVSSEVEHPAVYDQLKYLEEHEEVEVSRIGVSSEGDLDIDSYKKSVSKKDTILASFMVANNETGVIFPIKELSRIAHQNGVLFHADAVQGLGKLDIDVADLGVDLMSISSHKIHGPKGVGALYIKKGTPLEPLFIGGHQQHLIRPGTENVCGIVGFGKACEKLHFATKNGSLEEQRKKISNLRDKLQEGLLSTCVSTKVNGNLNSRVCNTLNMSFEYIEGESILLLMDELGIYASSGSACTSGSLEASHVLRAMGVPFAMLHGSIRFSLSKYSSESEVDYCLHKIPEIVKRLRNLSPFVK